MAALLGFVGAREKYVFCRKRAFRSCWLERNFLIVSLKRKNLARACVQPSPRK